MGKNAFFIITIFFLISLINAHVCAQSNKNQVDSIRATVVKFLIRKGELDLKDIEKKNTSFIRYNFFEILRGGSIEQNNSTGIYGFRSMNAPSSTYILLMEENNFKILDLRNFNSSSSDILLFLINNNVPSDTTVQYLQQVIELYKDNGYNSKAKL